MIVLDEAEVDGPRPVVPVAELVGVGRHPLLERREGFRVGDVGHRELVVDLAGLDLVKRGRQVEDRPSVLDGDYLRRGAAEFIGTFALIFIGAGSVGFARTLWRRPTQPALPPAALAETAQRMERLEGAVDTIAIEIERISEGQRFVTKLLSEGQRGPALGAGQRNPDTVRSGQ